MHILNPQTQPQRLTRILDESWELLMQRIATSRVTINKEASLQLHYSSILLSYGELFCVEPRETFTIELESANGRKSIDITCALGETKAAIELKCFRKASNRACDTDMYDVWCDLERLLSYQEFAVRKFFCLTDNPYYPFGTHSGHAGSVSTSVVSPKAAMCSHLKTGHREAAGTSGFYAFVDSLSILIS